MLCKSLLLTFFFYFLFFFFFFFNDTATTEIYTLSLHDALPICITSAGAGSGSGSGEGGGASLPRSRDRKSTRLNSSHGYISYAVFCLKKKKKKKENTHSRLEHIYTEEYRDRANIRCWIAYYTCH